jgi:hypothetical protein
MNSTIDICGLSWLPKAEHLKSIGKSSLTAKILCQHHNSLLSGIDEEMGKFIAAFTIIDRACRDQERSALKYVIDGLHVERWLLKTMIGLVESSQIKPRSGGVFSYKERCLRLLCDVKHRWPLGWGIYFPEPAEAIHHSSSFELRPMSNPANGELLALEVKLNGFPMKLAMGKPNSPKTFGAWRPAKITLDSGVASHEIDFVWPQRKSGSTIRYEFTGAYSGIAPTHDLPRLDSPPWLHETEK